MSLKFIRRFAVFIGAFCVVGETVRRWHTWREWPPSFFAHLQQAFYDPTRQDPAPIPHVWLTALIGTGWLLCVAALFFTLLKRDDDPDVR